MSENNTNPIPVLSKPLLYSRLFKFRAWDGKEMLQDIIPMNNYAITRVQGLENTMAYCYYVTVEKIMQYTGLKDKTGTDIYEGDLIVFEDKTKYVIIFKFGAFGFTNDFMSFIGLCESNLNILQVIGNVYENKNLLWDLQL